MFDPELKYCPRCRDEYRADIIQCACCKITLCSGREMTVMEEERQQKPAARPGAISPDDEIVTIHQGALRDIRSLEEILHAEKIPALVAGDERSCGKGCSPSAFYLQVRREDAPDALRILAAEHARTTALAQHDTTHSHTVYDTNADQATCPACGHTFSTTLDSCPDCGLCFG